jgi:hypothetical protein
MDKSTAKKMNTCRWKDDGQTNCVDTQCGHVINQYPHAAIDFTKESYMGEGEQWKHCQFCGRLIKAVESK